MTKKFPFNARSFSNVSLLKDLAILQPEKTSDHDVSIVIKLAKRFPQLQLNTPAILDKLREEFLDFQLSPDDLPTIKTYDAANKSKKPRAGVFWSEVGKIWTLDGKQWFELLYKLMSGLLCIPSSNADSERGFSMLRKIHTDQRASLDHSTIVALMSLKHNCTECCFDATLEKELLLKCKKAAVTYLKDKHSNSDSSQSSSQLQ